MHPSLSISFGDILSGKERPRGTSAGNLFASSIIQNLIEIEASHTPHFGGSGFFAPFFLSGWLARETGLF